MNFHIQAEFRGTSEELGFTFFKNKMLLPSFLSPVHQDRKLRNSLGAT